jgi:hypothetical protein
MKHSLLGAAALGLLATTSSAQLIIGNDDTAVGVTTIWNVNVVTGVATPLYSGVEAWGMAADDVGKLLYFNDGGILYSAPYSGGTPTMLGTITDGAGATLSMVSLSFANGKLYSTRNIGDEAIYEIDLGTLVATVFFDYLEVDWDFGGMDYDPVTGLFYGTNDDSSPNVVGVYSIDAFGTGAITLVTPYPAGENDIDGCAVGNGKVWLVEDEPSPLHNFDLATMMYDPAPPMNPMTTSEVFSSATWAIGVGGGGSTTIYCTAKTNSLGCVPAISGSGAPSASATSGFTVDCSMVRNNKAGLLFYTVNGAQNAGVFQCGTLCVGPTGIKRTPAQSAGGNPNPANDCSGSYSLDMNAFGAGLAGGNPDPALAVSGTQVHAQYWGRDQGFAAPCNTMLSDGAEYTIAP